LDIYCEYNLLERWYVNNLDLDSEPETKSELDDEVERLIFKSNSEVIVDLEREDMVEKLEDDNPLVLELYNNLLQGVIDHVHTKDTEKSTILENIKIDSTSSNPQSYPSLFFLNVSRYEAENIENILGIRVLGKDQSFYDHLEPLCFGRLDKLKLKCRRITPNSDFRWQELTNIELPFRHLCLVDRYLFSNEFGLRENFIPLVSALITGNASQHLQILIITEKIKGNLNLQMLHKKVIEQLSSEFPSKTINVTITKSSPQTTELHDRRIITEYLTIKSGQSFAYFKQNKINLDTELEVVPHTDKATLYSSQDRVNQYKAILRRTENTAFEERTIGDTDFRLFE
jgi:hypothetical protein